MIWAAVLAFGIMGWFAMPWAARRAYRLNAAIILTALALVGGTIGSCAHQQPGVSDQWGDR